MRHEFHVRCPNCNSEVQVKADDIELAAHGNPTFSFTCPSCLSLAVRSADPRIFKLLTENGVKPNPVPGRIPTPRQPVQSKAPDFTWDDVLDFHAQLEGTYDIVGAVLKASGQ